MENVIGHIPLAIFTSFGALGAGAFVGLAIAFFMGTNAQTELRAADKRTVLPFAAALIGFIAVLFHVTQPLKAFGVFAGVGSSPLSNEVVAGVVFMVFAAIYTVAALAGKLGGARKGLIGVTAVLAVVFGIMMGMAYMVDTIPTWNNPGTILQMFGFTLAGSALSLVVLGEAANGKAAQTIKIVTVIGIVLAVVGVLVQVVICSGSAAATQSGAAMVIAVLPLLAVAAVAAVIAVALLCKSNAGVACVALLVAVFCARLAFYGMELGLGL